MVVTALISRNSNPAHAVCKYAGKVIPIKKAVLKDLVH